MAGFMDYVGRAYIGSGATGSAGSAANEILIPMRRGTRWSFDRNVESEVYAQGGNGALEPSSYTIGQMQPILTLRTRCFSNWFTVPWLKAMLGTNATLIYGSSRAGSTGLLTGLGKFFYQYGAATPKAWTNCKLDSMTLSWDDLGNPVDATLVIRPYGARVDPTVAVPTGALPVSPVTPIYEQYIAGKGVSYSGLDKVHAGSLTWRNGLMPDFSGPYAANTLTDVKVYPKDYYPSPPRWTLSLTQDRDESVIPNMAVEPGSALVVASVTFTNNVAVTPTTVIFTVSGALPPDEDETMAETLAMITRTFSNLGSAATASIGLTGTA